MCIAIVFAPIVESGESADVPKVKLAAQKVNPRLRIPYIWAHSYADRKTVKQRIIAYLEGDVHLSPESFLGQFFNLCLDVCLCCSLHIDVVAIRGCVVAGDGLQKDKTIQIHFYMLS